MTTPEVPERPAPDLPPHDGIAEEDNFTPLWFSASWIASWVFGVIYIVWYVALSDWSQAGQWREQVVEAEARAAAVRAEMPDTNPYRGDPAAIAEGAEIYTTICSACHMPQGQGLVGPSLVDPYWKYGSSDLDQFVSVDEGRPLGMPPWGPQLGAEKIWKVLAFVETLPESDQPGVGSPDYAPPVAGP